MFAKAKRHNRKLRATIDGPTGSGKTLSALLIASGLSTKRIALIDTEHHSAELYADDFDFDHAPLDPPYNPGRYIERINAAAAAGYDVLIIDSFSHAWEGDGGVLELHGNITAASKSGNSYTAWRDVTPKHNALVNTCLAYPGHLITTMRSKMEYIICDGTNGKKGDIKRVGMAPIQRAGTEYEFDLVLDMSAEGNYGTASKKRFRPLFNEGPFVPTKQTGVLIREFLESGAEFIQPPAPQAKPEDPEKAEAAAQALADWRSAIDGASSLDELSIIYKQAYEVARNTNDKNMLAHIIAAKDVAKAKLGATP